jgi:hypothetical protein
MPKPITVSLIGGLGNQLFGYYAASALAQRREVDLVIDATWAAHGTSIRSLELSGKWISLPPRPLRFFWGRSSIGYRAVTKAARQSAWVRRRMHFYDSPVVGHDPRLLDQPAGARIRGYFQSWQLVAEAVAGGSPRRPKLRDESHWLVRMRERAQIEHPVMVHVRRGDYVDHDFGILGDEYYAEALEKLRAQGLTGPVWIFSDEPMKVPTRLRSEGEIVTSPADDIEEMILMSHGAGNIVANSTFSWWGAWMNPLEVPVVFPRPWFATSRQTDELCPPWWEPQNSYWESP